MKSSLLRVWLSILMLSMVVCACVTTTQPKNKSLSMRQEEAQREVGRLYLAERKYTIALRELLKAEKMYADDHVLQDYIGICYREKNNYDAAIRHFNKALAIRPDYAVARNNLGVTYLRMEQWDTAIQSFEHMVNSDYLDIYTTPHYPLVNLGYAYFMKGEYPMAEKYYRETLAYYDDGFPRDATFIQAYIGLGRTLVSDQRPDEAVVVLTQLRDDLDTGKGIHPKLAKAFLPRANYELAEACVSAGQPLEAKQFYRQAANLLPDTELGRVAGEKAAALP